MFNNINSLKLGLRTIFVALLGILIVLSFFIAISRDLAFSQGIDLNIEDAGAKGLSLTEIAEKGTTTVREGITRGINLGLFFLIIIIVTLFAEIGIALSKRKLDTKYVEFVYMIEFSLIFVVILQLFLIATEARDFADLRVWGPAVFGVLVLLISVLFTGIELFLLLRAIIKSDLFMLTPEGSPGLNLSSKKDLKSLQLLELRSIQVILLGTLIVIIQNSLLVFIALFNLLFQLIGVTLLIDLIGFTIIGLGLLFHGYIKKHQIFSYLSGGALLIWVILTLTWRNSGGPFTISISSTESFLGIILLGSFFLAAGLILLTTIFSDPKSKFMSIVIVTYSLLNIFAILAVIGELSSVYLKLIPVPLIGIIVFFLLTLRMRKLWMEMQYEPVKMEKTSKKITEFI